MKRNYTLFNGTCCGPIIPFFMLYSFCNKEVMKLRLRNEKQRGLRKEASSHLNQVWMECGMCHTGRCVNGPVFPNNRKKKENLKLPVDFEIEKKSIVRYSWPSVTLFHKFIQKLRFDSLGVIWLLWPSRAQQYTQIGETKENFSDLNAFAVHAVPGLVRWYGIPAGTQAWLSETNLVVPSEIQNHRGRSRVDKKGSSKCAAKRLWHRCLFCAVVLCVYFF